jgi:hypothetical protein
MELELNPILVPVKAEVRQAVIDTGELVTVLVLHTPGGVSVTLWEGGSLTELVIQAMEVDSCTQAGVVLGELGAPLGQVGGPGSDASPAGTHGATEGAPPHTAEHRPTGAHKATGAG